jgi:hypothetical protein
MEIKMSGIDEQREKVWSREKLSEKITYEEEPSKWISLHNAALGNIITAIKQLKRINFSNADISGTFEILLEKQ